jgi:Cof subfamily protein (haloacid dehalogenase superfamily)
LNGERFGWIGDATSRAKGLLLLWQKARPYDASLRNFHGKRWRGVSRLSLVIADVDGTLLGPDKVLTDRSRAAIGRLAAADIRFTIISSRPPVGMRRLVAPLSLCLPMGAFNGGALLAPDLAVIEQHVLGPRVAQAAVEVFTAFGIDVWLFTADAWFARRTAGARIQLHIERHTRTLGISPTLVDSFDDYLSRAAKIVGVSGDGDQLSLCDAAMRRELGGRASIARSQPYYVDVTPAGTDKGVIVDALSRRLGLAADEIATIGDMENDIAMFRKSGFSIAMGNASLAVKHSARAETLSTDADGFAIAVERLILPRAVHAYPAGRPV